MERVYLMQAYNVYAVWRSTGDSHALLNARQQHLFSESSPYRADYASDVPTCSCVEEENFIRIQFFCDNEANCLIMSLIKTR